MIGGVASPPHPPLKNYWGGCIPPIPPGIYAPTLLQGFPSAWPRKSKLHYLDVLHGRLLGSLVNFHWQLGGYNNHQPCSSNDISHCSSSHISTELDSAVSSLFSWECQDVCSAGNTFEKIAEGCRWELKARNSAVQLCAYMTWATMWNIIGAAGLVVVIAT